MVYGRFEELPEWMDSERLYVYARTMGDVRWLIMLNHSDKPAPLTWPAAYAGVSRSLLLSNYPADEADKKASMAVEPLELRPHEARIYALG